MCLRAVSAAAWPLQVPLSCSVAKGASAVSKHHVTFAGATILPQAPRTMARPRVPSKLPSRQGILFQTGRPGFTVEAQSGLHFAVRNIGGAGRDDAGEELRRLRPFGFVCCPDRSPAIRAPAAAIQSRQHGVARAGPNCRFPNPRAMRAHSGAGAEPRSKRRVSPPGNQSQARRGDKPLP